MSAGEGTCSQESRASDLKQDQRHDLCVCLGHGDRGYMKDFLKKDSTNKSWACGKSGAEAGGGGEGEGWWQGGWTLGRGEWNLHMVGWEASCDLEGRATWALDHVR